MTEQYYYRNRFIHEDSERTQLEELIGLLPQEGIFIFGTSKKDLDEDFENHDSTLKKYHLLPTGDPEILIFGIKDCVEEAGVEVDVNNVDEIQIDNLPIVVAMHPTCELKTTETHTHSFTRIDHTPGLGIGAIAVPNEPIASPKTVNLVVRELSTLLRGDTPARTTQPPLLT